MKENGYQGYTNYETWNVALRIGNEYNLYRRWQDRAEELKEQVGGFDKVYHGVWTEQQAIRYTLADEIRQEMMSTHPLVDEASVYNDILTYALDRVDWHEVADSVLAE